MDSKNLEDLLGVEAQQSFCLEKIFMHNEQVLKEEM